MRHGTELQEHRLANGLRLTIAPVRRAPIAAVNLWYHVGSANERSGRTGFAHLFEHMLFQGSAHVGANEHFELIQRAGGTANGSTWLDRTNYYETLPSHQLSLALWLEADRMARLLPAMTQQKLDTQRDVVINERRWSMDNQPYGTWWERLLAQAYPPNHPFHHSLMGSVDDLKAATLGDVKEFFATYYVPDNTVLSLVGDVEPNVARARVEEFFGDIPRGPSRPPLPSLSLPESLGVREPIVIPDNVAAARVFLAFRIGPLGSDEHDQAMICTAILGTGHASRLHRGLVRDQKIATSATAFTFDLAKGHDLLVVDVTGRPDVPWEQLEAAAIEVVSSLQPNAIPHDEVDRAIALTTTELLTNLESSQHHADRLSLHATYFGDPRLAYEEARRLERVDVTTVEAFARRRLMADNRLSLAFVPRNG